MHKASHKPPKLVSGRDKRKVDLLLTTKLQQKMASEWLYVVEVLLGIVLKIRKLMERKAKNFSSLKFQVPKENLKNLFQKIILDNLQCWYLMEKYQTQPQILRNNFVDI